MAFVSRSGRDLKGHLNSAKCAGAWSCIVAALPLCSQDVGGGAGEDT